ncbi:hypothetical protein [uncultured Duncaniella sp.]|jgi:hypothetical protein|uniref:hypothetical protein n=1 Tax=uncultured Duncaniella sp. TaxID=2768039 RepID=UPI0026F1EFCD|nr:hypothetical protein [uncultured Duncaniella sp.]
MAAYDKTILSAGTRLRAALEPVVAAHGARIFPVVSAVDEQLPFVTYFRAGTSETGVKPPGAGPRETVIQFQVFSAGYGEGLEIAEEMLEAIDGFTDDRVRYCAMMDSSENFDGAVPAYVQIMTFKVKTFNN